MGGSNAGGRVKGGVHERREQRAAEMVGWLVAAAAGDVETAQLILHSCDKACVSAQDHHVRPQCLVSVCLYVRTVCFVFVSLCCCVLCVAYHYVALCCVFGLLSV